jgi:hypothetical protein
VHVNLLPKSFLWRRAIRLRVRRWGFFYGALAIALLCWKVPLILRWNSHQNQLQEIHAATNHIRDMQAERISLAKEVMSFEHKVGQLKQATTNDQTTSILGILANGVLATEREVQIQEMQVLVSPYVNDSPNSMDVAASRPRTKKFVSADSKSSEQSQRNEYRLTLRSVATKSEAITAFVNSLQGSKAFPIVELRSTQERLVSNQSVHEFQLECIGYE